MQREATAIIFLLLCSLSLPHLDAKDASKPAGTDSNDKDLCSYLKDVEAKTDTDCSQDVLTTLKSQDPAAYSQKLELAHKRRTGVLKAYESLKTQQPPAQQTLSGPNRQSETSPTQLKPPINERTFPAWVGSEAKDLKEVYTRWLQKQNKELQEETENPIPLERRKEIDAAFAANQSRIDALDKIKDPEQLKCFLGETCGSKSELSDPSENAGAGKGAWTKADFDRANEEIRRQNLIPGGKLDRGVPLGMIASEVVANTPLGPLAEKPADQNQSTLGTVATMALATTGALILFGGLGGKQLEEKFPNIRRNMGIGAAVAAGVTAVVISLSALLETLPVLPSLPPAAPAVPQLAFAGGGSAGSGAIVLEKTGEALIAGTKAVVFVSGAKLTSDYISYAKSQKQTGNSTNQQPANSGDRNAKSPRITFGHGSRHLEGANLKRSEVEESIRKSVQSTLQQDSSAGNFWGRVSVQGRTIEYRAFRVAPDNINIGTYYFP